MRSMHKWSDEKSRKVCLTHGLRKSYIWHGETPKRQKTANQKKTEKKNETSKTKDYHTRKWCPISGCLTITVKMSAHLKGHHGMNVGAEYYETLKSARPYKPYTSEVKERIRGSLRREDEHQKLPTTETQGYKRVDKTSIHTPSCSEDESIENEGDFEEKGPVTESINGSSASEILSKFLVHLLSPDGGKRERKSSLQTVNEVRTIISFLGNKVDNLIDRFQVRDSFFRDYFDKKRRPGTCKHYVSSLISFMDFLISEGIQLSDYTSDDFTTMKLRLYNWRKIYNAEIETQKWVTEEDELEALVTPEQLAVFENGELARKAIKLFCQVSEDPAFEVALLEFTNLRDYLMTIIALANAHRSGVSANMTLTEFKRAKIDPKSGNVLMHVMNHKTLRKHGPAVVCLTKHKFRYLELFVNQVRPKVGSNCQNVFITWNGMKMESGAVSRQINSIWKRSGVYGDKAPPKKNLCTTVICKSVTTLVHEYDESNAQPVADLLGHNLGTAKKIYRIRNREKQALKGSSAIANAWYNSGSQSATLEGMSPPLVSQSPESHKLRQPWSSEEVEEVKT